MEQTKARTLKIRYMAMAQMGFPGFQRHSFGRAALGAAASRGVSGKKKMASIMGIKEAPFAKKE